MTFLDLKGRKKTLKNARKYLVNWHGETRSKGQTALKKFLYPFWKDDMVLEEFRMVGTRMTFDLVNYSRKIALEFQGIQHNKYIKHFHGSRTTKFLAQIKRDLKKHEWCELNNFSLIEIYSEKELTYEYFLSQGVEL
jgi:hypothetical protein